MSFAHRPLSRLPLSIFVDLKKTVATGDDRRDEELKDEILKKLKKPRKRLRNGKSVIVESSPSSSSSMETVADLLKVSPLTLLHWLDPCLTFEECQIFHRRVSQSCVPEPVSVYDKLHRTQHLHMLESATEKSEAVNHIYVPTGLTNLDAILLGGFRKGSITELAGKAGTGKTQLTLQTCISASACRNLGSIFIDTENKLSLNRLAEMASKKCARGTFPGFAYEDAASQSMNAQNQPSSSLSRVDPQTVLQNMAVFQPTSTDELIEVLKSLEDHILLHNHKACAASVEDVADVPQLPIGVLVIDSIAAPARRDFGKGTPLERTTSILQCAQILKRLADELDLVVIAINQVGGVDELDANGDQTKTKAALGSSWKHCVSTSVTLDYEETSDPENIYPPAVLRKLLVTKSNYIETGGTSRFQITSEGVSDVLVNEASNP